MPAEPRIHPLLEVSRGDLEAVIGGGVAAVPIASFEPVKGGFSNTLHKVTLTTGEVLVVKHFALPESYRDEVSAIRQLAGVLPVPELVGADDRRRAIAYRWIDGMPLEECFKRESRAAFASLAEPLGRFFAWMAGLEPVQPPPPVGRNRRTNPVMLLWDIAPIIAQAKERVASVRVRERMGEPLAKAIEHALDVGGPTLEWGKPCLAHHDIGGRNILVQPAERDRFRIIGVIDWESAGIGSPLVDIGSLFRHVEQFDAGFLEAFERGYREYGGTLPPDWNRRARLLDSARLLEMLDEPRELPGVFAECRHLLTRLAHEYAGEAKITPAG